MKIYVKESKVGLFINLLRNYCTSGSIVADRQTLNIFWFLIASIVTFLIATYKIVFLYIFFFLGVGGGGGVPAIVTAL